MARSSPADMSRVFKTALPATPLQLWRANYLTAVMIAEAQMVIGMRLMGMIGMWAVAPGENARMVTEKQTAFTKSANAALRAAATGKRPDQIVSAAVRPIRRKTKSNMARLAKRGPQAPGL